jgi:hypothetical protein
MVGLTLKQSEHFFPFIVVSCAVLPELPASCSSRKINELTPDILTLQNKYQMNIFVILLSVFTTVVVMLLTSSSVLAMVVSVSYHPEWMNEKDDRFE